MPGDAFPLDDVFDEDYLRLYGPGLEEAADGDVETIWRVLDLEPGIEVLDLGCGHGRIANRLAARGARVTALPRWLPAVVVERDGDLLIDRSRFDPATGRATTERVIVRDRRARRFSYSVRMFIAAELRDWLLTAGFASVELLDQDGAPLTARSRCMIAVAHREPAAPAAPSVP